MRRYTTRRRFFQVDRSHKAVDVQHLRPRHFRQTALGQQAQGDHLLDAVAGMHVTEAEQRIVEGVALDQRHTLGIAAYRYILRQALDGLHAGHRRQGVLGALELATGQAQCTGNCRGNAEPGKKM